MYKARLTTAVEYFSRHPRDDIPTYNIITISLTLQSLYLLLFAYSSSKSPIEFHEIDSADSNSWVSYYNII